MKKKVFLVLFAVFCFCVMNRSVFAWNISSCDNAISDTIIIDEKIPNTVSTVVTIIKIVVPILLVIFGMIDLFKGITAQKEDEMKKGQQMFIKRLLAGAIIFFVFSIVQVVTSLVAGDENKDIFTCANCFLNKDCSYRPENNVCKTGTMLSNGQCVKSKN